MTFDGAESQKRKREGKQQAAENAPTRLQRARELAVALCKRDGSSHADAVGAQLLICYGIETLGPAAGSIFSTRGFVWTGEFVPSERASNHGRLLRVWRLREASDG